MSNWMPDILFIIKLKCCVIEMKIMEVVNVRKSDIYRNNNE